MQPSCIRFKRPLAGTRTLTTQPTTRVVHDPLLVVAFLPLVGGSSRYSGSTGSEVRSSFRKCTSLSSPLTGPIDLPTRRPTDPPCHQDSTCKAWYLPNGSLNCLTQDWTRSELSNSRYGIKIRHAISFMHSFHICSDIPSFIHSFIHSVSNKLVLS